MRQLLGIDQAALKLRRMHSGDLEQALRLTQAERWSHRLEDWQFHFQLGRGWVMCDVNDVVVGTALWWPYGEGFATLGLIVVDRNQQGKGIGRQLMEAVINDAGPRVLQLVATQAGLKLYRQCGFEERGGIEQRQGMPNVDVIAATPMGVTLQMARQVDVPSLCQLDGQTFGADRSELIKAIFQVGTAVLARRDGRLIGFAMLRSSGRGTLIGPIVADSQVLATTLIAQCLRTLPGFIRLDIPAEATELAQWLDLAGLACVDRVTVMRRGDLPPSASTTRIFGLASQAFS